LVNVMKKGKEHIRLWTQILFTALTNGYLTGFIKGKIFTGKTKNLCVPGLNCYSCPGALGSCPLGSLQAVLGSRNYKFSFYIVGFFLFAGALGGRFVCGFLCPFGLVQDLLYKIPFVKKVHKVYGDKLLRGLKYVILIIFVILLPLLVTDMIGQGQPWFCKWICPSGTLMGGLPLMVVNQGLREAAGFLFAWKSVILIVLLILSVFLYRPFCRYLCPLGGIYGLFNPIAFYRYKLDKNQCTGCKECEKACKMGIKVSENPNSIECIRCGDCKKVCRTQALR
jgi:ferredoxin-type protein NapH